MFYAGIFFRGRLKLFKVCGQSTDRIVNVYELYCMMPIRQHHNPFIMREMAYISLRLTNINFVFIY